MAIVLQQAGLKGNLPMFGALVATLTERNEIRQVIGLQIGVILLWQISEVTKRLDVVNVQCPLAAFGALAAGAALVTVTLARLALLAHPIRPVVPPPPASLALVERVAASCIVLTHPLAFTGGIAKIALVAAGFARRATKHLATIGALNFDLCPSRIARAHVVLAHPCALTSPVAKVHLRLCRSLRSEELGRATIGALHFNLWLGKMAILAGVVSGYPLTQASMIAKLVRRPPQAVRLALEERAAMPARYFNWHKKALRWLAGALSRSGQHQQRAKQHYSTMPPAIQLTAPRPSYYSMGARQCQL